MAYEVAIYRLNLCVEMEATVTLMMHHQFQFLTLGIGL